MLRFANEKAEELFQIPDHQDRHVSDLFLKFTIKDLVRCEKDVLLEQYIIREKGDPLPVFMVVHFSQEQQPVYYITIHNLAERRQQGKHSYEPLQELLDIKHALDESSIVAVTDRRGIIRYANHKFCEMSKYDLHEIVGSDHRLLNSGHHSREFFKELWRTIGTGRVWKGEIKNRAKDGSFYWVDTTIVPFLNTEGKPYQYLAIRNEITERKRVEQELQHMMTRLINVQEDERKQVSRELHDGIGQELYSLLISLHRIQQEVDHPLLQQTAEDTSRLIQSVREMSWELRPSALDELGLLPALRSFANRLETSYRFLIHIHSSVHQKLPAELETTVYRIIQEAITNVRKYAGVKEAYVDIQSYEHKLSVSIEDFGTGIKEEKERKGVGLFSMEERAKAWGGVLKISTSPGNGTKIEATFPLQKSV
ncbi:PAS domain S-box protein [Halobacillus fulvus]|nr:PAS domain S-box protein [Halobacillus fulvus]